MPSRREVGERSRRKTSRAEKIRERVLNALDGDDGTKGLDARGRGDNAQGVDARESDVEPPQQPKSRKEAARDAAARGAKEARERAQAKKKKAKQKATSDALKAALIATASDVDFDEFVDGRKKSRNAEVAERAEKAAQVRAPMGGSLRTVGDERVVTDMARAGGAAGSGMFSGAGIAFEDSFVGFATSPTTQDSDDELLLLWGPDDEDEDRDGDEGSEFAFDDPFGVGGADDESPDFDDKINIW